MLLLLSFLALTACQQPFEFDQHYLEGFRIAAVSATPAGGAAGTAIEASAALVVDGKLWSDQEVDLSWYWLEEGDDGSTVGTSTTPDGTGPTPALVMPFSPATLALVANSPDGADSATATLALGEFDMSLGSLSISSSPIDHLLSELSATDFEVSNREEWTTNSSDVISEGGLTRLEASVSSTSSANHASWMVVGSGSTFFELDDLRTDWAAAEVVIDEDDLQIGEVMSSTVTTILGLLVNDQGGVSFKATEIAVGSAPIGLWTNGRFLSADAAATVGVEYTATLTADDDEPTGLRLENLIPTDGPYVTSVLGCTADVGDEFDPNWLVDGRCTREQLDGAIVLLTADDPS